MAIRTVASLTRPATRSVIRTRSNFIARRNFSTEYAQNLKNASGKRYPSQGHVEGTSSMPKSEHYFWGTILIGFFLVPFTLYMRKSAKAVEKFQREQALKAQLPTTTVVVHH